MATPDTPKDTKTATVAMDAPEETISDLVRDDLNAKDKRIVNAKVVASAKLVHEIIRQRGIEELERPAVSLAWSAIGAGFVIGLSPYAMAAVTRAVPDAPMLPLLLALAYSVGFIAVIAGRMQLFTESTLTAVLPLATTPCWSNLRRTLRLWLIVFAGNLVGTLAWALFVHFDLAGQPELGAIIHEESLATIARYEANPFLMGIPAGFMLAALVWSMPNLERQEIFAIALVTGLMALAGVAHCIVGSAEMWVTVLAGDRTLAQGLFGFLFPAALGNLLGGGVLFALLADAQVSPEIREQLAYRFDEKKRGR